MLMLYVTLPVMVAVTGAAVAPLAAVFLREHAVASAAELVAKEQHEDEVVPAAA